MERTSLGSPSNRIKALNRVGKEYEYAISNPTAKMSFSQNDEMSVKLRINDGSMKRFVRQLHCCYCTCSAYEYDYAWYQRIRAIRNSSFILWQPEQMRTLKN